VRFAHILAYPLLTGVACQQPRWGLRDFPQLLRSAAKAAKIDYYSYENNKNIITIQCGLGRAACC